MVILSASQGPPYLKVYSERFTNEKRKKQVAEEPDKDNLLKKSVKK